MIELDGPSNACLEVIGRSKGQKEGPELGEPFCVNLRLRLVDSRSWRVSNDIESPIERVESNLESKVACWELRKGHFWRTFTFAIFFEKNSNFFFPAVSVCASYRSYFRVPLSNSDPPLLAHFPFIFDSETFCFWHYPWTSPTVLKLGATFLLTGYRLFIAPLPPLLWWNSLNNSMALISLTKASLAWTLPTLASFPMVPILATPQSLAFSLIPQNSVIWYVAAWCTSLPQYIIRFGFHSRTWGCKNKKFLKNALF